MLPTLVGKVIIFFAIIIFDENFSMKNIEFDPEYDELMKSIGNKLKDLRKKQGVSYTTLAKKMGISRNGYNNIELAKSNFQFLTLLRILKYHNISFFQFFESLK